MIARTKQAPSYPLRLSPELRETIESIAKEHGRSLNAEIIIRLEESLIKDPTSLSSSVKKEIKDLIKQELSKK